jgi:hypothetical protein
LADFIITTSGFRFSVHTSALPCLRVIAATTVSRRVGC